MQIDVHNTQGEVVGTTELDETIWGIEPNIPVMHQALVRQLANARLGTSDTKTRGEVRGGGRKPWRQKGTGRARQGTIRAPQWKGGGVVFGPHPRKYTQAMPRQMRRLAIRSALSAKLADDRVTVIKGLGEIEPKTKAFKALLGNLPASRSVLVVLAEKNDAIERSAANLDGDQDDHRPGAQHPGCPQVRATAGDGRSARPDRNDVGAAGKQAHTEPVETGSPGGETGCR